MTLKEFVEDRFGAGLVGAVKMARELMEGDAAKFKAGYTADNAALAVADAFKVDVDDVKDALRRGYVVEVATSQNDEGSDFATVTSYLADGEVVQHHFAHFFDEGGESAAAQASSFVAAMNETADYSMEERLGAYGREWEREQDERGAY
jgi:hypothetical protein